MRAVNSCLTRGGWWLALSLILTFACGCGTPSFLVTPVANSNTLDEQVVETGTGFFPKKVAIIEVEGMLANAKSGGLLQATENPMSLFVQQLDRAESDPSVAAVVLRVNSPGGTVTSSDAMYDLIKRFKAKTHKPVVASIQEVGASGAYYVSCAADKIVAQPTSIVGSVGVIFESMEFSGTLGKIGAKAWSITSGSLKDMGSPFKPLGPEERGVMQQMVDEYFIRFINIVRTNRNVKESPAKDLMFYKQADYAGVYSGRVFSGETAQRLGLVDQLGLLSDAIDLAKKMSHSPDASVIMYKRPYGYSGSIYASSEMPPAKANITQLNLPGVNGLVPAGFYYLWQPGL